jgi:hypothetical protein
VTDPITITAIAACIAALAAVLGAARSFFNGRGIQEMHLSMNSRLSQLIEATRAQAHAEGRAEGVASGVVDPAVAALAAEKVLATARAVRDDA